MQKLSELVSRKFSNIISLSDVEIETDTGWQPITAIAKTVPYHGFEVKTNHHSLRCADDHILFREGMLEVFAKNLKAGDRIISSDGVDTVVEVIDLEEEVEMFDVAVDSNNHRFFSNGLLSHNTTIINALCYALYNKPFDNISLQRLINSTNATKNTLMEVRLVFIKDNIEYDIYRARGEDYRIEIRRDGEDITPGKGVTECDTIIQDIIGISYDLFTKTVIFSGNSQAFLQLPVHQQRMHIEELFNITMLSEKAKLLKEAIKLTEQDIKISEAICIQQQVAIDVHKKHVKEAEARIERWKQTCQNEMQEIDSTLSQLATVDFETEKLLHDERARLKEEVAGLALKLSLLRKDLQQLEKETQQLISEHTHLENAKCPYCTQAFADAPIKLAKVETDLEIKGAKLVEVEEKTTILASQVQSKKDHLGEVEAAIQHPNFDDLLAARENVAQLHQKLAMLNTATNPHIEVLTSLNKEAVSGVDTLKVDALRKRLDHQNFLLKLLTDKNSFLRRRIINQTIPFLNSRLNHYTLILGLPHIVKFDADMSCVVAEFDRELDFGNLSAGEKKRVNAAMALAFRDVLHHMHAKTNLLLIDELDGALDQNGIDSIVRVLKEKSRDENMSVFIISHHPSIAGRLDRDLKIIKEQGFSRVEQT
ncbi:MAG: Chromosome partition protein Smc [Syntrophomonadaceae bacterium]|nr:Chromosome partition protein Smc [Bacillota bacterium]